MLLGTILQQDFIISKIKSAIYLDPIPLVFFCLV